MPFIPMEEGVRVALEFDSLGGNSAANVFYVRDNLGNPTTARLEDLYDIIANWAVTEWAPIANEQWTLRTIATRSMVEEFAPFFGDSPATTGSVAQQPMPAQDTVAITLQSGFTGRSRRGRLYHVGLSEADITDGLLTPTSLTAFVNAYEQLRLDMLADDFQWMVASFVADGVPRGEALQTAITSIAIRDNKVDRQVRRKK